MRNILRHKNFYLILLTDAGLIVAAHLLAYWLRFEGRIPAAEWDHCLTTGPYILPFKLFVFLGLGLYRGMWRYTGLVDLVAVLKATALASVGIIVAILLIYRFEGFPRSVFILDWLLTFLFLVGVRVGIRVVLVEKEKGLRFLFRKPPFRDGTGRYRKRLVIIGAGNTGEKMLREVMDNPGMGYDVVGFLDDDPGKRGMEIHGVSVLGPVEKLHDLTYRDYVDEILIAVPKATSKQMRRIIQVCESTGLKFRTTPKIEELIDGRVTFRAAREVSFEDLLGRDPVSLDLGSIGSYLNDKILLVSGAGGSIGAELCRQITGFGVKNLILLDKTENNLFHLEMEFRQRFPRTPVTPILGDVRNSGFIEKLFSTYKPGVVFHGAAFKHVPIVELNPWEGVFNNIIGTRIITSASLRSGVERFILISTDKAVRPTSVMGATKRVAEMVTSCAGSANSGRYVSVRFGNVIGSEGSVIHLFKKQIERLGPLTVTHPEITRYFMTIPEASKLILQAGAFGQGQEIYILDMGTPVKILEMARDLIRRSGFRLDEDIEIQFIGLRPGEKLHEELITEGEGIIRTPHEKIFVLKGNPVDPNWLGEKIKELTRLASDQDAQGIKAKLKEIIPEYKPYQKETADNG